MHIALKSDILKGLLYLHFSFGSKESDVMIGLVNVVYLNISRTPDNDNYSELNEGTQVSVMWQEKES